MKSLFRLLLLCIITYSSAAQKIKSEDIPYQYRQLPSLPVAATIRNYTITLLAPYEEKNQQLTDAYTKEAKAAEDKYKKEMTLYPVAIKAAEEKYEAELAAYNKKSVGQKLMEKAVLNENNKPVKQLPSEPSLKSVTKPALQTTYDLNTLAKTYVQLQGFQLSEATGNTLKVFVTLYGYDGTQPRTLSEQKDMISYKNGSSNTYKATYYHTEFSYRHPMALKVLTANEKELINVTPEELNIYKVYKSNPSDNYVQANPELLIKTTEEAILQANLQFINQLLNNKLGFAPVKRTASLSYVKNRGDEYADLTTAFNEASSGLLLLVQDSAAAKAKLKKAIATWQTALSESNLADKKARIDKDVTTAVYLNMLEVYFALAMPNEGKSVLEKLNALNLSSGERKQKNDFELAFADLQNRIAANL